MSEALAAEAASYGVKVTIAEPTQCRMAMGTTPPTRSAPNPAYDTLRAAFASAAAQAAVPDPPPEAAAPALLKPVDAEHPPLRVVFRSQVLPVIRHVYAERLATRADWERLSQEAEGVPA
ncbi:hypothetical protein ACFYVL_42735 [Streptomyces sp. NPDC004111]|uniref:hypothetical protein n=1 Tax=Streptomyces sp. NPDC004111 TaxID=3364690 RepID=UPI0036C49059